MLNLLHVTEDHSLKNTGITTWIDQLSGWVTEHGGDDTNVHIFSGKGNAIPPQAGVGLECLNSPNLKLQKWRCHNMLLQQMLRLVDREKINIVHIHGIWKPSQLVGSQVVSKRGIPSIISPHGMLTGWALRGQGIMKRVKKSLYWKYIARPAYGSLNVIHAITLLERDELSQLFSGKRIEVIPNAIDLSLVEKMMGTSLVSPERFILFFGRIHPVKGVELLIQAFNRANLGSEWRLLIVGPVVDKSYFSKLRELVRQLGESGRIEFMGPLYEKEKFALLKRAWVVVSPSYSEVIGMVNLECGACNTPTITSNVAGLQHWEEEGGVVVSPDLDHLTAALLQASRWSDMERLERGNRIRKLVESNYSLSVVGKRWKELYSDLVCERGL